MWFLICLKYQILRFELFVKGFMGDFALLHEFVEHSIVLFDEFLKIVAKDGWVSIVFTVAFEHLWVDLGLNILKSRQVDFGRILRLTYRYLRKDICQRRLLSDIVLKHRLVRFAKHLHESEANHRYLRVFLAILRFLSKIEIVQSVLSEYLHLTIFQILIENLVHILPELDKYLQQIILLLSQRHVNKSVQMIFQWLQILMHHID